MAGVRVFQYVDELDAFLITDEFQRLADDLGLTEWHAAVWIGRLFMLDNDYGAHWFDNWDEREAAEDTAREMGLSSYDLMIINPERMASGSDGPCHPPELRKRFWTDVLQSLELSHELIFDKARQENAVNRERAPAHYIPDLEARIRQLRASIRGRELIEA
jgi:hypothetical protein